MVAMLSDEGVTASYTVRVRQDDGKCWVEYVADGELLLVSKEYPVNLYGTSLYLDLVRDTVTKIKAEMGA